MKPLALALLLATLAMGAHADTLRAQIEAADKIYNAAIQKKDFATLNRRMRAGVTPDFRYFESGQKGEGQTFDAMVANMKRGLSMMGKITAVDSKLISLKEGPKTAVAVSQRKIAGMVPGPDKKMHAMIETGSSTDTYLKVGGNWKLSTMAWKNGRMTIDGKPIPQPAMTKG